MLNQEQIQGKWLEIRGGIRSLWGKLTDDELDKTKGDLMQVGGLVEGKYGESKEVIKSKIDSLMASFDNATDRNPSNQVSNSGESSFQRNPTAPRTAATSEFQDIASEALDDSPERAAFDKKTYNASQKSLNDPDGASSYSGANPNREVLGAGKGAGKPSERKGIKDADQEVDKKSYQAKKSSSTESFDSDRNARH